MNFIDSQLFAAGDTISHLNSRTPELVSIMTSLQDSFSSISQLADSVTMPDRETVETNTADDLRVGLERVRLMLLAEEDETKIHATWAELDTSDTNDEGLLKEIKELQARIDGLPAPNPAPAEKA